MKGLLDDRVQHILMKVQNSTLSDVVEELALDSDIDELLDMRVNLFSLAKDRLEYDLRKEKYLGEDEDSGIVIANRTSRSKQENVAKEVVDLYKYINGLVNNFPWILLSKETKYLNLLPPLKKDNEEEVSEKDNPLRDKVRVIELTNLFREQERVLDKLIETNQQQQKAIDRLEQALSDLQEQMKKLKSTSRKSKGTEELQFTDQKNIDPYMNSCPPELWQNLRNGESRVNMNKSPYVTPMKKAPHPRISHITDRSGTDITVLHKTRDLHADVISDLIQGKQPGSEIGEVEWPLLPAKSGYHPDNTTRVYHAEHMEGVSASTPMVTRRKPPQSPRTSVDVRKQMMDARPQGGLSSTKPKLRGRREEASCTLYLKNICIENGDRDCDIEDMIKDYCKKKDLRVMNITIMRYKAVKDIVGCRIIVPQSSEQVASSTHFWPEGVTCRRWEAAKTWYTKNPQRGYRQGTNVNGYNQSDGYYDYQRNEGYFGDGNDNWEYQNLNK